MKTKKGLQKLTALCITLAMALILMPAAIFADFSDYYITDIYIINNLVDNNNLQATKDSPDSWDFVTWDTSSKPYRMKELNLKNQGLTGYISLNNSTLVEVDLSDNPGITDVDVVRNKLTKLDITGLTNMTNLMCNDNQLTELDLSTQTEKFTDFVCESNQLTNLDLQHLTGLINLYVNNNDLTSLDISSLTKLENLNCASNSLTSLDIPNAPNLAGIDCSQNRLQKLEIKQKNNLYYIGCRNNELDTLILEDLPAVQQILCDNNKLYQLDLRTVNANLSPVGFSAQGQTVNLTLVKSKNENYSGKINLNQPEFFDDTQAQQTAVSYENGVLTSSDNTLDKTQFQVSTNHANPSIMLGTNCYIHFTYTTAYTIEALAGEGGKITPSGETVVQKGEQKTFTFTPDKGYRVSKVMVDDSDVTKSIKNNSYTFENIAENHTIKVTFEKETNTEDTGSDNNDNHTINAPNTGNSGSVFLLVAATLLSLGVASIVIKKKFFANS